MGQAVAALRSAASSGLGRRAGVGGREGRSWEKEMQMEMGMD